MLVLLYILIIVLANVVTAMFAPLSLGVLIVPMGTFLIGATFILRDLVQHKHGKKNTYLFIFLALIASALVSFFMGDVLFIVFASALSFIVSETMDTEIYSRLKASIAKRMLFSGLVGGLLDSTIFVVVALSPIGLGVLTWGLVGFAILGQVIVKSIMQFLGVGVLKLVDKRVVL